ncbi:hypothetical protein HMPREF0063_11368 [Aeromicrobium marinum DSM 15272]|uniref:Heavy metal transporter n=1 Tax=Aeromicrobium marinum DSM 15272 TaxID=585531 RepID=E2SBF9_9ACTN|nr:hypothetical protein [Aeromicrobium marinum]EFQ83705.1 hypothetical protein HMPREF0063_11368 [Aeromicrobium marinum DSM 15272]
MPVRWIVVGALVAAASFVALTMSDRGPLRAESCSATVGETRTRVDLEQARWASLMSAMAVERGLPPRATTIAIATAFQESKVRNIDYGDRDSVGLFQQRPSQGWGSVEQILDPVYAIGKFYDGLVQVPGYEDLEITVAAQAVQRSGFPDAYAQHEDRSRALASALRGFSPAAFSCSIDPTGPGDAADVAADLDAAFGPLAATVADDVVSVTPSGSPELISAAGWSVAHYAVANASRLRIGSVSFEGRTWSARESDAGWVASTATGPAVSISTG